MANTEKSRDAWNSMTKEQQKAVIDTIIGEANVKSPQDVRAIVDSITARSLQLGVSPFDIVSAQKDGQYQYDAYGDLPPKGNAAYADMAEAMMKQSLTRADPNAASFYARPEAVGGLPKGLEPYPTIGSPHQFYTDPQARSILTAQGYKNPEDISNKVALLSQAVEAVPSAQGFAPTPSTSLGTSEQRQFLDNEFLTERQTNLGRVYDDDGRPKTRGDLVSAVASGSRAFNAANPGYTVEAFGNAAFTRGKGDLGNHSTGRAIDSVIIDSEGKQLSNYSRLYDGQKGNWKQNAPLYQDWANRTAFAYAAQNPESVPSDMRWGGYFGVADPMHVDVTGRSQGQRGNIMDGYADKKMNAGLPVGGGFRDFYNRALTPEFTPNQRTMQQDMVDYGIGMTAIPEAWGGLGVSPTRMADSRTVDKMPASLSPDFLGKPGQFQQYPALEVPAGKTVPSAVAADPRLERQPGSMPQAKPASMVASDPRLNRAPGAIQRSVAGLPAVPTAPVGIAALGALTPSLGGNMPDLPSPRPGNATAMMFDSMRPGLTPKGNVPGLARPLADAYKNYQQSPVPQRQVSPGFINSQEAERYSRMPDPRMAGWRSTPAAPAPSRAPDQSQRFAQSRTGMAPNLGGNMPGLPGPRPGNATVSMFDGNKPTISPGFINSQEAQRYSKMPDPRAAAYQSMPPSAASPRTVAPRTVSVADLAKAKPSFSRPQYSPPAAPAGIPAATLANQYSMYQRGTVPQSSPAINNPPVPQRAPSMNVPVPQRAPSRMMSPPVPTPRPSFTPTPPQPSMTPNRAKELGMVPTVPGKFMPDVKANPAQVLRDQLGLIARNPIQSIGQMIAGTMLGGVFHAGGNPFQNASNAGIGSLGNGGGGGFSGATGGRSGGMSGPSVGEPLGGGGFHDPFGSAR